MNEFYQIPGATLACVSGGQPVVATGKSRALVALPNLVGLQPGKPADGQANRHTGNFGSYRIAPWTACARGRARARPVADPRSPARAAWRRGRRARRSTGDDRTT